MGRVELAYAQRAQGVDSKAGVIVGAAGVIVTLGASGNPSVATVIGLATTALAGGFAVWAFSPRAGLEVGPNRLIDRGYLTAADQRTRVTLLTTRAGFQLADEGELIVKAARLKAAFWSLLLAVAIVLTGLIIGVAKGGNQSDTGRQSGTVSGSTHPSKPGGSVKPGPANQSSVRPSPHG